ncbi:N-6 DNA methylase [Myxococcota bacterium]|nr:N-6 DNA methylase [Myxococcota bacterium]
MSPPNRYAQFHETWLGMAQPSEGLVFSAPVLSDAQIMNQRDRAARRAALNAALNHKNQLHDLRLLLQGLLGYTDKRLEDAPPLSFTPGEGRQTLRPTHRLIHTPRKGDPIQIPIWWLGPDLDTDLDMDKPEEITGPWRASPNTKMTRLLWGLHQPIGLLINGHAARLFYAPAHEALGWIEFRFADMADTGGAPLLDAFTALLSPSRALSQDDDSLLQLMRQSRQRQADITEELAQQVRDAIERLLDGFDRADATDPLRHFEHALRQGDAYPGALTVLLRLVFLLYAEDRELLPVEHPIYQGAYSVLGLYARLIDDAGRHPDEMGQRFGAWSQLINIFRAVYHGGRYPGRPPLIMPAREGELFHPDAHAWLEGRAPLQAHSKRERLTPPRIPDDAILFILERLLILRGQRLSYKTLSVEQLGGVYEQLMGFSVQRLSHPARRLKASGAWITAPEVQAIPAGQRAKWLRDEYALSGPQSRAAAAACEGHSDEAALLDALSPYADKGKPRGAGELVVQPGKERRRTSSHYTPPSLSGPIVARALEPILNALGPNPTAEQLLSLKICDPAMGSGAFLVESCRALAKHVVIAWAREGVAVDEQPELKARREVARRCLYGVDKNKLAVTLARLSLWLETFSRELPFTFLDHALRHGDSLMGLTTAQIAAMHWAPKAKPKPKKEDGEQLDLLSTALAQATAEARAQRQELAALPPNTRYDELRRRLDDANTTIHTMQHFADAVIAAFLGEAKAGAREKAVKALLGEAEKVLVGNENSAARFKARAQQLREAEAPFHWPLAFPEVFGEGGFDVIVGNPPFLGGKRISSTFGDAYRDWLAALHVEANQNADIAAHFFRRADTLLKPSGAAGLIATNTIAQGDTRASGLGYLIAQKPARLIYDAVESRPWPGDAAVTVSTVHFAKGAAAHHVGALRLNEVEVKAIDSYLKPQAERAPAVALRANENLAFVGAYVLGMGFTLTPEERAALVARDPRNAERTFPYLGGREINSSPTQDFDRYVISFGEMSLEQAAAWPDLLAIVEEKVKPEREKAAVSARKAPWWLFWRPKIDLLTALQPLKRCLVTARVTKHLVFAWQPADRIFSDQLYVFPREEDALFAALQSRIHEPWARHFSSQMKTDLRYSPTDCLANFPFPRPEDEARAMLSEAGRALYEARAAHMITVNEGLTQTYNRLKDMADTTPEIEALRRLHEALDIAVLRAYGWDDLIEAVPPYGAEAGDFEAKVMDALFKLNAARAQEEAQAAQPPPPSPAPKLKANAPGAPPAPKRGRPKKQPEPGTPQEANQAVQSEIPFSPPTPRPV